jgi:8-oxo-dGTP diphosphatase
MIRTALIIPIDSHGLALLQQKTYDAPNYPGVWSLFGGSIEEGEDPVYAARRELKEELDIQLPDTALEQLGIFPSDVGKKERIVYIAMFDDQLKMTLREGRGLGYFSEEEIIHLSMPEHIRKILKTYFEMKRH